MLSIGKTSTLAAAFTKGNLDSEMVSIESFVL